MANEPCIPPISRRQVFGLAAGGVVALGGGRTGSGAAAQAPYPTKWKFGDITISKIVDLLQPIPASLCFPGAPLDAFEQNADWLVPNFYDPEKKAILFSFHAYVIRTPHRTMIVDTCFGNEKLGSNGKPRGGRLMQNLTAAGVKPEDVDCVMNTHFHLDHVGMNTTRRDGRWVPTFQKARYLFNRAEVEKVRTHPTDARNYAESIEPVIAAGQADIVDGDHPVGDGVRIVATPGHTPGHYCVALESKGHRAILSGDILHSPIEIVHPEWIFGFDEDKQAGIAQRLKFLDSYTDADVAIFPAHFGGPTGGHIVSTPRGRRFKPLSA